MADGALEQIEILGVSAFNRPPIGTLHLTLEPGLNVLYGKNGSGKTRTLEAVRGALTTEWEHETSVWVHMRVVDEPLPGVLVADENFRESLFFELSDALVRSIHYSEPTPEGFPPSMRLDRLWEFVPLSGESDVPDSIQGLVAAIAWLHALDEMEAAAPEILARCYLSAEINSRRTRVYLSSMAESTPILNLLGRIALAMNKGEGEVTWDRRSAREFQPPSKAWSLEESVIRRMIPDQLAAQIQGATDENTARKLLRAAFSLEPRFEFFHLDRPGWVPTPLLTLCGGVEGPIVRVWDDKQQVEPNDLARMTLAVLTAEQEPLFEEVDPDGRAGIAGTPKLRTRLAQIGDLASNRFAALLKDAPPIEPVLLSPASWLDGSVVSWTAYDVPSDLRPVELSSLSEAQQRWANVAIRQSLDGATSSSHLILDEPERALHAAANAHLADGLAEMADATGALVLVASHAPGMLSCPHATLLHVHRDDQGDVQVSPLPSGDNRRLLETADALGLNASDILQLTRVFLYVEGEHDRVVLEELFAPDLNSAGVRIMTMGGVRKLATVTDSRFLFDYTDAAILVALDNVDGPQFARVWEDAQQEIAEGNRAKARTLIERAPAGGNEWEQLRSFAMAAIDHGKVKRLHLWGLNRPDIIYYLPADYFVAGSTWDELNDDYQRDRVRADDGRYENIKLWLKRRHDINVTARLLRSAARLLGQPDDDLQGLARRAVSLALPARHHR